MHGIIDCFTGLFEEYLKDAAGQRPEEDDPPQSGETFAQVQLKVASMLKAARVITFNNTLHEIRHMKSMKLVIP